MLSYCVKPLQKHEFSVEVPASKSILSRALILSAFTEGEILLCCGKLCEDIRALIGCLRTLGAEVELVPAGILVRGGKTLKGNAVLDVHDSGTAARFLTAVLAFSGGNYELRASAQMSARPMDFLPLFEQCGVRFEFLGEKNRLPFRMHADGTLREELSCDTSVSTQFASGLMLAAAVGKRPFRLHLTGEGVHSSYLSMTAALIEAFGGTCRREQNSFFITPIARKPRKFSIEPDISSACYFFALSILCRAKVTVRGISLQSLQGDIRFLDLLRARGAEIFETDEGVTADGTGVEGFEGFSEDISDLADQAPTIAALAPFAKTPSLLTRLNRIRYKESDRTHSIAENLRRLGIPCTEENGGFCITPMRPRGGEVDPFGDHRIAMAFALIGLKSGSVTILHPDCAKKTFEDFFSIVDAISAE